MLKHLSLALSAMALLVLGSGCQPECNTTDDCTASKGTGYVCNLRHSCEPAPQCSPECSGATPTCDPTTLTCKVCTAQTGCSGATPVCNTSANNGAGKCITCTANEGCGSGLLCDTSVAGGQCVQCTSSAQCGGSTPVCDTSTKTCKACIASNNAGCSGATPVCDTAANNGAGQCITCSTNAQCGTGKVCDTSVAGGACVGCLSGNDCSAGAPICEASSKQCKKCTATAGCGAGFSCDTTANNGVGACVQCTSDAQCGGSTPVCDTSSHTCKTCLTQGNAGCGGTTPVCVGTANGGAGQCATCTASAGCGTGSVCDTSVAGGQCVQCTSNAQCGGNNPVCDTTSHTCKTCLGNNVGCGGTKPVCDVTGNAGSGVCVTCLSQGNAGCGGTKPVCDASVVGGVCVACLSDASCGGSTPVCDTSTKTCKTCLGSGAGCGGSASVCVTSANGGAGQCVQCVSNATCGGATPVCDVTSRTCVSCVDDSTCGGSTPKCDVSRHACVECLDNSACGGDPSKPYCDTGSKTCKSCLADNTGCSGATPTCDTSGNSGNGTCVVCTTAKGCSGSTPTCDTTVPGGECVACTADAQCANFPLTPYCDLNANKCVQCLTNNGSGQEVGCSGSTPYCDATSNTCKTCLTSGNAGCDASAPACYGGGNNGTGQCVACTDNNSCGGTTAVCDTTGHTCKTCLADNSGCSGTTPACNTTANGGLGQCVTCTTTAGCSAPTTVCDVSVPVCVQCLNDSTCGGTTPYCNTSSKTCRSCLADNTGCGGTTPFCDTANDSCAVCVTNANCAVPTGVCDRSVAGGQCVQCVSSANCGGTTPYCNTAAKTCKTCLADNSGCGGTTPVCNTSGNNGAGACVTCLASGAGCGGTTPVCDTTVAGGQCVGCVSNANCGGTTPVCDTTVKTCKTCTANGAGCGGSTPVCDTTKGSGAGACVVCTDTLGCSGASPVCLNGSQCVQCVSSSQCSAAQDCDTTTHACVAPPVSPATVSQQIANVHGAPDGAVSPALPITGALVTYKKPLATGATIASDPPGFFLQAEQTGGANTSAVFVQADPTVYSVNVGDRVSLSVTGVLNVSNLKEVTSFTGLSVSSSGHPVRDLVQDVSSVDLVANAALYESEVIKLTGTVASAFATSGGGYSQAQFTTAGNPTAANTFRLRLPDTVRTAMDLVQGCTVTLDYGVLWRFSTTSQVSAFSTSDFTSVSCPAPKVVSAVPASTTQVLVTFDRQIQPSSVLSNGSQFTFTNGLTATAATVSGTTVTLTTNTQSGGANYTLTVASTVKDLYGTGVDATANTAAFTGYLQPAKLLINEANVNITGGRDLIELLVVTGGNTKGMQLLQQDAATSYTTLATLPDANVAAGDIIVVHMNPTAASGDATTSETTSKTQNPKATYSSNYDTAWDVAGATVGTSGATYSYRVIVVRTATGTTQDVVGFARSDLTGTSRPSAYPTILKQYQDPTVGQWSPANCGGIDCAYDTGSPTVLQISVDWKTSATTSINESVHRINGLDSNSNADWSAIGPSTFGLPN